MEGPETSSQQHVPWMAGDGKKQRSIWGRVKDGLFGVLFVMCRDTSSSQWMIVAAMVIDLLQLLEFPMSITHELPWSYGAMHWFASLCNYSNIEYFVRGNEVVFYIALGIVVFIIANVLFVSYLFSRGRLRFLWTLKLLRLVGSAITSVLFIPIVAMLSSRISCEYSPCWSSGDVLALVHKALAIVLGIVFMAFAFIVVATYYEQDPTKKATLSRAHARVDLLFLLAKATLTIIYNVSDNSTNKWVFIASTNVAGIALAVAYTLLLPYHSYHLSVLRACVAWVFEWASLCLLFAALFGHSNSPDVFYMFFITAPGIVLICVMACRMRRNSISSKSVGQLKYVLEVELKVRFYLDDHGLLQTPPAELLDTEAVNAKVVYAAVNDMYVQAAKRFPESPMLRLFWGHFFLIFMGNKGMATAQFDKASSKAPLDVQYVVYRRRMMISDEFSAGSRDVMAFVEFQTHMADAKRSQGKAVRAQLLFWVELMQRSPRLVRLHTISATITKAVTTAQMSYEKLMKINPESSQLLRAYAGFQLNIMNNNYYGEELLDKATEFEAQETEAYTGDDNMQNETARPDPSVNKNRDVDHGPSTVNMAILDDNSASITISGSHRKEGTVLDVNATGCRLLGYRRTELVSRNVTTIIPAPFLITSHTLAIRSYLETGCGTFIMNNEEPRLLPFLHKSGHIVVCHLAVRQLQHSNADTAFFGIIRPVKTDDQFVLLDALGNIFSFTSGLSAVFGISLESVREKSVQLSSWIPGFDVANGNVDKVTQDINGVSYDIRISVANFSWSSTPTDGSTTPKPASKAIFCKLRIKESVTESKLGRGMSQMSSMSMGQGLFRPTDSRRNGSRGDLYNAQAREHSLNAASGPNPTSYWQTGFMAAPRLESSEGVAQGASGCLPPPLLEAEAISGLYCEKRPVSTDTNINFQRVAGQAFAPTDDPKASSSDEETAIEMEAVGEPQLRVGFPGESVKATKTKGRTRSVTSGSQRSSQRSSRTEIDSIRRRIIQQNMELKPSSISRYIVWSFFALLAGAAVIAIVARQVTGKSLTGISDTYSAIVMSSNRRQNAYRVLFEARTLILPNAESFATVQSIPETKAVLIDRANMVAEENNELMNAAVTSQEPDQLALKTQRLLDWMEVSANYKHAVHPMTLTEGIERYTTITTQLALSKNVSLLDENSPDCQEFLYNGLNTLMPLLVRSTSLYQESIKVNLDQSRQAIVATTIAPLAYAAGIIVLFIIPLLIFVESQRNGLMHLMLRIPPSVAVGLYERCRQTFESMSDIDDGLAEDDELFEDDNGIGNIEQLRTGRTSEQQHKAMLAVAYSRSAQIGSIVQMQARGFFRIFIALTPIIVYFIVRYANFEAAVQSVVPAANELEASDLRRYYVYQVNYAAREALIAPSYDIFKKNREALYEGCRGLEDANHRLLYGDSSVDPLPAAQDALMFTDGCVADTPAGCDTFHKGIMKRGLWPAQIEFINVAKRIVDSIENATFPFSETEQIAMAQGADMVDLLKFSILYLRSALIEASTMYQQSQDGKISSYMAEMKIYLGIFITIVALIFIFLVSPFAARLNNEIVRTRMMLLMVPSEVLRELKGAREFIKRQLN